ncbi:MAG: aminoglycoside phosphotransferase family protein [Bacteroidota bacterium]
MLNKILIAFGLNPDNYCTEPFGSGLINSTWKISGNKEHYILQSINHNVFKNPHDIADNLTMIGQYLKENNPAYLFAAPLHTKNGNSLVESDGNYYRLSPYINNSHTINAISQSDQAYEAARQFGKFTHLLQNFDPLKLKFTLTDFHNLTLRVEQFETALKHTDTEKLKQARFEIQQIANHVEISKIYEQLIQKKQIPLRVIHHDTKINNVLFDENNKGLCVIDLDTVMPGYFISDVGDMMRTYLSAANEEEQDMAMIQVDIDNFAAIYKGYMQEMGKALTQLEKSLFIYAGKFMIYMQALRFLTDFLNGDTYYQIKYPGHNLTRAKNQLILLNKYIECEDRFDQIILKESQILIN